MKIANATALVTGANRGIGASLVRELAARGARRVYAATRQAATLPPAEAGHDGIIVTLNLDVTDPMQADPADVARATLDAVEQGTGDVLPDPVSVGLWQAWNDAPRGLDQLFAGC